MDSCPAWSFAFLITKVNQMAHCVRDIAVACRSRRMCNVVSSRGMVMKKNIQQMVSKGFIFRGYCSFILDRFSSPRRRNNAADQRCSTSHRTLFRLYNAHVQYVGSFYSSCTQLPPSIPEYSSNAELGKFMIYFFIIISF